MEASGTWQAETGGVNGIVVGVGVVLHCAEELFFRFKVSTKIAAKVFLSIISNKKNRAANLSLNYNLHMSSWDLILPQICYNRYNFGRFITECMISYSATFTR